MWLAAFATSDAYSCGHVLKHGQEEMNYFTELLRTLAGTSKHAPGALLNAWATTLPSLKDPKYIEKYSSITANFRSRLEALLGDNGVLLLPGSNGGAVYLHQDVVYPQTGNMTIPFSVMQLPATACPIMLNSQSLPIGIQVVGAHGQDRLCLAMAAEIQKAFGGWKDPSLTK